jgi:hypothetical protein
MKINQKLVNLFKQYVKQGVIIKPLVLEKIFMKILNEFKKFI